MKNSPSIVSSDKSDTLSTLGGDISTVNPEVAAVMQRAERTEVFWPYGFTHPSYGARIRAAIQATL